MNDQYRQDTDTGRQQPYASSPCSLHEFDRAPLDRTAIVSLLNELIEGERAGAQGLVEMARLPESLEIRLVARDVAQDEARFCAMLSHHVTRLKGTPSRETGAFASKLAQRDSLPDKLRLLDKGQSVVVRTLNEAIPRIADEQLKADLIEMRDVHVVNIARCARYL